MPLAQDPGETALPPPVSLENSSRVSQAAIAVEIHCSLLPELSPPQHHIASEVTPQRHLGTAVSTANPASHLPLSEILCSGWWVCLTFILHRWCLQSGCLARQHTQIVAGRHEEGTPFFLVCMTLVGSLGLLCIHQLAEHWVFPEDTSESQCGSLQCLAWPWVE